MRDYRKRGDRMGAEKIGGLDRHARKEDRIGLSVTKLARLIGRRMAREMFEDQPPPPDEGAACRKHRTSKRELVEVVPGGV